MSKTVLIVDDESSNIDIIRALIPKEYKVRAAISPVIALKIVGKQMPDLIFLDVIMPQMSGFEVLKEIRQMPGGDAVKVVFVSGNDTSSDPEAVDADGHLQKPISPSVIADILAQHL